QALESAAQKLLDKHYQDVELKLRTRYAEQPINPDFYGTVEIGNSDPVSVSFKTLKYPIYRRVFTSLMANELISVQPMSLPSGLLFYMGYDEDFYLPKREQSPAVIADPSRYPHQCPRCTAPAYIGLVSVDCSRKGCS